MKKYFFIVSLPLALFSCSKEIRLTGGTPDFNVSTSSATFQAGKEVVFNLEGNAGLISFYSGEPLKEYAFKDGRVLDGGPLNLSFTSAVTGGTQTNQFSIVASTNFNGNYDDFASIQAATWTNITNRFTLGTSATFANSTVKDIADLVVPGKPLYIAYKYVTQPQTTAGAGRSWMVQTFSLKSTTSIGDIVLGDMATATFRIVNQLSGAGRSTLTATRLTLLSNVYDASNDPYHEIWGISKPMYADKIDLGPDRSVAIKGLADPPLKSYAYTFTKAGTYKVTFVAANVNIDKSETVVKELTLTITP